MFKVGSLGCKMLIIGLIVVLLAGVFGVVTGPPIRKEIRMQQYHVWALEFEETWSCVDIVGIAENTEGYLEVYLRGEVGSCTMSAGAAFYDTEIFILEKIAEKFGRPVDYIVVLFAPDSAPDLYASEFVVTEMSSSETRAYPGNLAVPEYLNLWEGRGE
jgi:hypothetical protein